MLGSDDEDEKCPFYVGTVRRSATETSVNALEGVVPLWSCYYKHPNMVVILRKYDAGENKLCVRSELRD